jgi:deoxyribodipyrimidine photo-lyase
MQLERTPRTRDERASYLAAALDGLYSGPAEPAPTVGGRRAALQRLQSFAAQHLPNYASTRNHTVQRGVSVLSPYIRHGVLGLAELRDYVLARAGSTRDSSKFVNELAWRAFWQQVYDQMGDRIFEDMEPPKYERPPARRQRGIPSDIAHAETGLRCIDESLSELYTTGYMHNHGRMWVAAYVQHWRGIDWRDGAHLFYQHLLDGDPASNTLSWQWVGSTFSHKPYYFNRENVEKFSAGAYCARCPLAQGGCPFDASYDDLGRQLFGALPDPAPSGRRSRSRR